MSLTVNSQLYRLVWHEPIRQQQLAGDALRGTDTILYWDQNSRNMPASSGASHGFASFVSLIIGAIMSKYIWQIAPSIGEVSLVTIQAIQSISGVDLPTTEQFSGAIVVMFGLSFLWGIIYHISRHR
jgi:hypothetical protein